MEKNHPMKLNTKTISHLTLLTEPMPFSKSSKCRHLAQISMLTRSSKSINKPKTRSLTLTRSDLEAFTRRKSVEVSSKEIIPGISLSIQTKWDSTITCSRLLTLIRKIILKTQAAKEMKTGR